MKVNPQLCLFSSACPQIANHCLFYWNLLYSSFVASALKRSLEEFVHYCLSQFVGDEATWHNENVSIVVLTDQTSHFLVPCKTSADALMFVQCHHHSLAAAADSDARIALAALYCLCQRMSEIRIVTTCVAVCTEVLILITFRFQILDYKLLQRETCVVTCHSNCLYFNSRKFFKGYYLRL